MRMREKIRKANFTVNLVAAVTASSLAAYALAAPDYDRIKKDINVMVGIVKSSIEESRDCQRCSIRVSGYYLADQGVVFNIDPSSPRYAFGYGDDVEIVTRSVVAGIPDMVSDILEDVQVNLDDAGHSWEWHTAPDDRRFSINRENREKVRDVRRELREASRELREVTIEMIHAEEEELRQLQEREAELASQIAELENKQSEVEAQFARAAEQRARDRRARREKHNEERLQEVRKIEDLVLDTFCDYSRTMRSIPKNERVSIVVKQGNDSSNVFVFDQDKLGACDSSKKNVRDHALAYAF